MKCIVIFTIYVKHIMGSCNSTCPLCYHADHKGACEYGRLIRDNYGMATLTGLESFIPPSYTLNPNADEHCKCTYRSK